MVMKRRTFLKTGAVAVGGLAVLRFAVPWWLRPGPIRTLSEPARQLAETALAEWPNIWLEAMAQKLESWSLKPAGTEGYRTAEVTLGGVDTRDLSSKTMESATPGLFFIGEIIDVTGHLGGFNFQWAWSSGFAAGEAI